MVMKRVYVVSSGCYNDAIKKDKEFAAQADNREQRDITLISVVSGIYIITLLKRGIL